MTLSARVFPAAFAALFLATLLSAGQMAAAQSTLTLDDFDLGGKPAAKRAQAAPDAAGEMEKCLLDNANCQNKEFKNSKGFSIDDVVNLGIVDREEVKPQPASTGSGSGPAKVVDLPSIDMEILFDYDSDALRPDQYSKLTELAGILKGDKFSGFRFAFLGHSDAKGEDFYNRELSRRRARSVSQFMASVSGIPGSRFVATGLGASQLKTPGDPFGAANRRVQLLLIPVK